jgi:tRNA A37 N6-isopentenylltransferase MiaA
MKQRSRNYARRQLTWMRKMPSVRPIDMTELAPSAAADKIAADLRR